MDDVREGPGQSRGEDGDAQENEVEDGYRREVAEPHPSRVQPRRVGVSDGCSCQHLHGYSDIATQAQQ